MRDGIGFTDLGGLREVPGSGGTTGVPAHPEGLVDVAPEQTRSRKKIQKRHSDACVATGRAWI